MIEAIGLSKFYGPLAAIQDVSFSVGRGEVTGFLGPNGAGKSTTMRILTAFTPATTGTARIAGHDVHDDPLAVKRSVGYLPERVPLYDEMVVRAFLQYIAEVKGVPRREIRAEADRAMERCGLGDMSSRLIRNLSKGYRQRVGLAQALVGNPPVLILDEPTVGLDPKQIVEIRTMIKGLAEEHTVLLSTHILPEVSMVCERVIIINQGRIVAENAMDALAADQAVLSVEATGDRSAVQEALSQVAGVAEVREIGPERYVLNLAAGATGVEEAVAAALTAGGFGLRRLDTRTRTLEEVFIEAVAVDREEATP